MSIFQNLLCDENSSMFIYLFTCLFIYLLVYLFTYLFNICLFD